MARTPIHPGEILAEELEELGVSPTELSRQIRVPANRISQIINGKRAVTGDTALRLAHWFGTSPQFWMNLQALYDVRVAEQEAGTEIKALPTKPGTKAKPDRMRPAQVARKRTPAAAPPPRGQARDGSRDGLGRHGRAACARGGAGGRRRGQRT